MDSWGRFKAPIARKGPRPSLEVYWEANEEPKSESTEKSVLWASEETNESNQAIIGLDSFVSVAWWSSWGQPPSIRPKYASRVPYQRMIVNSLMQLPIFNVWYSFWPSSFIHSILSGGMMLGLFVIWLEFHIYVLWGRSFCKMGDSFFIQIRAHSQLEGAWVFDCWSQIGELPMSEP